MRLTLSSGVITPPRSSNATARGDVVFDGDTTMTIKFSSTFAPLFGLAMLGACASTGTGHLATTGTCRPDAAAALVGKATADDATILRQTGSTVVRRLAPGDGATKDYRQERVTVTITDGQVTAASCG
jgi:hypothetical protein